jgi:aspartate aminotransferase-like enzyme
VQSWALARGLALYAPEGYRSQTVTTVENRAGWDIAELNRFLLQREMRIANGYGVLKGKTFRIAHMGETKMEDIERLLVALDEFIASR